MVLVTSNRDKCCQFRGKHTMKLKPVTLQKEEAREALARARFPRWPTMTIEIICNMN